MGESAVSRRVPRPGRRAPGSVCTVVMATLLMLCFGMATDGFTAYLPSLRSEYGASDLQVSLLVTLRCVTSFVSALLAHSVYGRVTLRAGMTASVALLAVGFAVCCAVPSFAGACVGSLFMGVMCGIGSTVPASMLMHRWFGADVALPLCICMAGSGLSSVLGVPLVVAGISHLGMAGAFGAEAAVFALIAAAMWLVVRDRPARGARVAGAAGGDPGGQPSVSGTSAKVPGDAAGALASAGKDCALAVEPTPAARELGDRDLAVLAVAMVLVGAVASPGPANYSMLLSEAGAPAGSMAAIVSVGGVALTLSKLAYGELSRRFGTYRSNALAFGLLACGMACSLLIGRLGPAAVVALVVLCGLGFPTATAGPSLWVSDLFPHRFDTCVQRLQVAYSFGTLAGMPLPGLVAGLTGTYVPIYASYAVCALVVLALVQGRYRKAGLAPRRAAGLATVPPACSSSAR